MAFHYSTKEEARAAIYDAAILILEADAAISLAPISISTIQELSDLARSISAGEKVSCSPLVDC
jgi:hypothetical protein